MSKSLQSYMKEFNTHFEAFQRQKSEAAELLLNRNLSLLSGTLNIDIFDPNSVEKCQFYINLHTVISSVEPAADTLWLSVSVLQLACRNPSARQAIVNDFRFIPLLAKVLCKVDKLKQSKTLLSLLQDLTYSIKITWEEPYLSDFIQVLVDIIYDEDEALGFTALSVLVNLCYKNSVCTYLLLRTTRTTAFTAKIKCYGALAKKMLLILYSSAESWDISDLQNFIKMSFNEVGNCFQNWNVPYLRHIVEFITNAKDHDDFHLALKEYKNFYADMETLVQSIESRFEMDDMQQGEENVKNQQHCMGLIFELLDYILQLSKRDKSFSPFLHRLFNLVTVWIRVENVGARALNIIGTIVNNMDDEDILKISDQLAVLLPQLVEASEKQDTPNEQVTSLLKLFIALLKNPRTQGLVLATLTEAYLDKMFSPLASVSAEFLNYTNISENDLSKYLFCLLILIDLSNIAKSVWHEKVLKFLSMKQVHFVIAKGLVSGNEELCQVVFEISQKSEFPRNDISKIVAQLRPVIANKQSQSALDGIRSMPFKESKMCISKTLEERLDKLITYIFEANRNAQLDNVATSELIEMFNYKINLVTNAEKNLKKTLENATSEITNLSHQLSLQSNEVTKLHSTNFKLHLIQEKLQAQNSDLSKQLETLRRITTELNKKSEIEKTKYLEQSRDLNVKTAKIDQLHKQVETYKKQEENNIAEMKQLQAINKENIVRIDHYKSSIARYEEKIKQIQKTLEEKEKEIVKASRNIEELSESNLKSENLIRHLESQLAEKNEAIRNYEAELNETEEMRRTILSLMENKKAKRKT